MVAANADVYASTRVNFFFPGVVPSLDGQCVSLVKWFLQEMTGVPNPQAARGDAKQVGKTLVAQGHAIEVPFGTRRRGDIICIETGTYGHIWVVLSDQRVFEQNVNWPGVSSKIVDNARVYASRIGNDSEAWRHDMHVYRIKSYNEQGDTMATWNEGDAKNLSAWTEGRDRGKYRGDQGKEYKDAISKHLLSEAFRVDQFVNAGDIGNLVNAGVPKEVADKTLGLTWKQATYEHLMPYFKAGGSIAKGTYLKVDKSDIIEVN